jgi:hypothetical protein
MPNTAWLESFPPETRKQIEILAELHARTPRQVVIDAVSAAASEAVSKRKVGGNVR